MHGYGRRQKLRQDVAKFAALLAAPDDTGSFVMPANGRIRFVASGASDEGDTIATLTGTATRTIGSPGLVAGQYLKLDRVERGVTVDTEAGYDVELDTGLGVWRKIAEGA
jgi:hypothetical protein